MIFFGAKREELEGLAKLLRERIEGVRPLIDSGDVTTLCQRLEADGAEFSRGNEDRDRYTVVWRYPDLKDFVFFSSSPKPINPVHLAVEGKEEYFGFKLYYSASSANSIGVQAPNKPSVAGFSTTSNAKKLKKVLVSEHGCFDIDAELES